jgi:hypothetical protein
LLLSLGLLWRDAAALGPWVRGLHYFCLSGSIRSLVTDSGRKDKFCNKNFRVFD